MTILRAIGTGEKESGQIAEKCGMDPRAVFGYLNKLIDLNILTLISNPLSAKQKGKRYIISDLLYRFHFPFMPLTVGKWWGNIQEEGKWKESEIDIVAFDDEHLVIGECKYRSKAIGLQDLRRGKAQQASTPDHQGATRVEESISSPPMVKRSQVCRSIVSNRLS